jgi:hypothetical protein
MRCKIEVAGSMHVFCPEMDNLVKNFHVVILWCIRSLTKGAREICFFLNSIAKFYFP